nr:DNA-binding protein [uncultured Albidiferax sp.]
MQIATQTYPRLADITKPNLTTEEAAYYMDRRPQTLRKWAMRQHPIRPINCGGRLAWPLADIKLFLGVAA